jgi:hypothetical protein
MSDHLLAENMRSWAIYKQTQEINAFRKTVRERTSQEASRS